MVMMRKPMLIAQNTTDKLNLLLERNKRAKTVTTQYNNGPVARHMTRRTACNIKIPHTFNRKAFFPLLDSARRNDMINPKYNSDAQAFFVV